MNESIKQINIGTSINGQTMLRDTKSANCCHTAVYFQ